MKTSIEINSPVILKFGDYHEIRFFEDAVRMLSKKIKVVELPLEYYGFEFDGRYRALVYVGRKPEAKLITALLSKSLLE